MSNNPIKSSDLYKDDGAINEAIRQLEVLKKSYTDSLDAITKEACKLIDKLKQVNTTQAEGQETTRKAMTDAEKLKRAQKEYAGALNEVNTKIRGLKEAKRDDIRVQKLQQKAVRSTKGSYDQLSAQYALNKLQLNKLSKAEREATASGRALERQTKDIYEEMNRLQKATGKHQLQVGRYPKIVPAATKVFSGLTGTFGVIEGIRLFGRVFKDINALKSEAKGIEFAFNQIRNGGQILEEVRTTTRGLLSDLDIKKSANEFRTFNLDVEQLPKLLEFVAVRSAQTGKSFEHLRDSMVEGLSKESKLRIDNLGISMKELNSEIAIAPNFITAVANIAQREVAKAGDILDQAADSQEQFNASMKNFKLSLADGFITRAGNSVLKMATGFIKAITPTKTLADQLGRQRAEVNVLVSAIRRQNQSNDSRNKLIAQLQAKYPNFLKNLDAEKVTNEQITKRLKEVNQEYEKRIKLAAFAEIANEKQQEGVKLFRQELELQKQIEAAKIKNNRAGATDSEILKEVEGIQTVSDKRRKSRITAIGTQIKKLEELRVKQAQIAKDLEQVAGQAGTIKVTTDFTTTGTDSGAGAGATDDASTDNKTDPFAGEKLLASAMEEGRAKDLELLRISLLEKQKLWVKHGLDLTVFEEHARAQRNGVNVKWDKIEADERKKVLEERRKEKDILYKQEIESIEQKTDLRLSEIELEKKTEAEKTRLKLAAERDRLIAIIALNKKMGGQLTDTQIATMQNAIKGINNEIDAGTKEDRNIYSMVGLKLSDDEAAKVGESIQFILENIRSIMQARVDAADVLLEKSREEGAEAQTRLDQEIENRNAGYANNVIVEQKKLEDAKKREADALKEKRKAQKAQEKIDTAIQISGLLTSSVQIWKSLSGIPFIGPALAVAAIGTMWASYAANKVRSKQAAKEKFGDGGLEYLQGGSHSSGNDIPIGTTASGKQRTAEGGEAMAIINKRSTRKYKPVLSNIIDSINKGNFEEKYSNAFISSEQMPVMVSGYDSPDMKKTEGYLEEIRDQGAYRRYTDANGRTVEKFKNVTRTYV